MINCTGNHGSQPWTRGLREHNGRTEDCNFNPHDTELKISCRKRTRLRPPRFLTWAWCCGHDKLPVWAARLALREIQHSWLNSRSHFSSHCWFRTLLQEFSAHAYHRMSMTSLRQSEMLYSVTWPLGCYTRTFSHELTESSSTGSPEILECTSVLVRIPIGHILGGPPRGLALRRKCDAIADASLKIVAEFWWHAPRLPLTSRSQGVWSAGLAYASVIFDHIFTTSVEVAGRYVAEISLAHCIWPQVWRWRSAGYLWNGYVNSHVLATCAPPPNTSGDGECRRSAAGKPHRPVWQPIRRDGSHAPLARTFYGTNHMVSRCKVDVIRCPIICHAKCWPLPSPIGPPVLRNKATVSEQPNVATISHPVSSKRERG